MKKKRQAVILELIQNYNIETQEELAKRLQEAGFSTTQGTISRDIRELNLTKVSGSNGRQKYAPMSINNPHVSNKYRRVLSEAILSMEAAMNILVIKTVTGMAMACATAIDNISIDGIVGCIAGDDTIMCVIKDLSMVEEVIREIKSIIEVVS
ncbi:MAG: arginine repressor [Eubacteriales bacterium]|nr:arginine repressor [Eubacteriales bacterium]